MKLPTVELELDPQLPPVDLHDAVRGALDPLVDEDPRAEAQLLEELAYMGHQQAEEHHDLVFLARFVQEAEVWPFHGEPLSLAHEGLQAKIVLPV